VRFNKGDYSFNGSKIDREFSYSKIDRTLSLNNHRFEHRVKPRVEPSITDNLASLGGSIGSTIGGLLDFSPSPPHDIQDEAELRRLTMKKKKKRGIRM
jgi:hypothetical protein